jgi:galactoside 2-L-fucosyltransferase 1/2
MGSQKSSYNFISPEHQLICFRLSTNVTKFQNGHERDKVIKAGLQEDIFIHGFVSPDIGIFWGCKDYIKHKLQLKMEYQEKAKAALDSIVHQSGKQNVTTVGIHVRRGDKLSEASYRVGLRVPNMTYFNKAMNYFRKKYKNTVFIAASDDRKWVTENFINSKNPDVFLVPENKYQVDMSILGQCDHVIQSLGTFSKWAAFLSGGESIYFRDSNLCNWKICDPKTYKPNNRPIWRGWKPMTEYESEGHS